jgi:hydrogenase maturation protease
MKTIILGIGNPILGDDGIGVHVIRELQETYSGLPGVTIDEAQTGGMNLIDLMRGYERAILIDAVSIPTRSQGEVTCFSVKDIASVHSCNPHDVSLLEALELSNKIGDAAIPQDIVIVGINVQEMQLTFNESLSPEIRNAIPEAIEKTLSALNKTSLDEVREKIVSTTNG